MIKRYLIILLVSISIDMSWHILIAPKLFRGEIGHLMGEKAKLYPALIFYLINTGAILVFVINPLLGKGTSLGLIAYGGFLGFAIYSSFNFTNLAKELLGVCSKSREKMARIIDDSKEDIAGEKSQEEIIEVIKGKFEDEENRDATEAARECVMNSLEISKEDLYKLIAMQIIEEDNELFHLLRSKDRAGILN